MLQEKSAVVNTDALNKRHSDGSEGYGNITSNKAYTSSRLHQELGEESLVTTLIITLNLFKNQYKWTKCGII